MMNRKSDSIRDLINFYEKTYSRDKNAKPLTRQKSAYSYSSYNLNRKYLNEDDDYLKTTNIYTINNKLNNENKTLNSFTNLDKSSTTSSYSSKSSSSLSLNNEEIKETKTDLNLSYISNVLKENYPSKPLLKRTETFGTRTKNDLLKQQNNIETSTPNSFITKRKSTSFYVSKTSVKNEQNTQNGKILTRTNSSNGLSSNVRKFDPKSIQKIVLEWCQNRTKNYQNVNITNFSSSWADGLAFCALIHSYMPDEFDFNKLSSQNRRHNFQLAFDIAYKRANVIPLLEVSDMITMGNRPDDRCIYTYLSTIYTRFNNPKNRTNYLEDIKEHAK
ncbi:unnamed protein product [Brachionus calyciflorus]|uniref:Calponin-homology (CH) domain-containing protein n=1 Tax=Brachionus calyciflorus TaxID=104777 RepID=A0A813MEI3_9BILA|nr:unnamed protein product [Brachionus calyciflorus]